jgi:hypothetical protein
MCELLKDGPNVVSIPCMFEFLWNTIHMCDVHRAQRLFLFIQMTATLGINNWVSETLGIRIELKITSQVTNFIVQILSFLTYGEDSVVKSVN